MAGTGKDFRYGFRLLFKNRGFTSIAILILALGIGANTAIFSIVHTVLLKNLPYKNPETLILIWGTVKDSGDSRNQVSATDIADLRSRNKSFEEISTYTDWRPIISGIGGEVERIGAIQVGDGFFKVMKASPLLGRLFRPEEQTEGKDFVVVLSYQLWQRKFGSDSHIIGKTIKLNLRPYVIVGVLKPDVQSLPKSLIDANAEVYRPVAEPYNEKERGSRHLRAIGRIKNGVSLSAAQAEMTALASQLEKVYPDHNTGRGIRLTTIAEDTVGKIRPSLILLTAAAGLVLLIACANLANLLLARAAGRSREIAVRTSLGASRWHVIRQLLVESTILTFIGATLGVLFAYWGIDTIKSVGASIIPQLENAQLNLQVLLFTMMISIVAGLLFGLAPAVQVSKLDLTEALKEGNRGSGSGRLHGRMRNILVAIEVGLALLLLTGAGLLIQSVARLHQVNPGFDPSNVLTMNVWLPGIKYEGELKRTQLFERIVEHVEKLPGVLAAGTTHVLPLSPGFDGRSVAIDGQPRAAGEQPSADMYVVTPHYLTAMKIPLLRGRYFSARDSEKAPFVTLVNETMAKRIWKNEDPIGKRIRLFSADTETSPWRTVVGIVRDVRHYGLDADVPMQFYIPQAQFHAIFVTLAVRYSGVDVSSLRSTIRQEILRLDPDVPVFQIMTLENWLNDSIAVRRLSMLLFGGFAFLAVCLAIAGIYGVVSFVTMRRTQEIGIRMTLGAQRKDVVQLVLKQGMLPAIIGALAGLIASFALTRLMAKLLFAISPADPITFCVVLIAILVVTAIACYVPARRAAKVDPLVSLRYE
jgi:putative ABC transport system permease protein